MPFWAIGATLLGSALSADAAGDAADSQAASSASAIAEQRRQFDTTQENAAPYLAAGRTALGQYQTENNTPLDQRSVQLEPGYQFGLNQGMQAQSRQIAAAGGRVSGAAIKAATQYATDYGSSGYSAAYNRANQSRTDRLNRLAALSGVGQTATQQIGAAGSAAAGNIGNITMAQGNATGAAQIAQSNIWGSGGNQLAAMYANKTGVI